MNIKSLLSISTLLMIISSTSNAATIHYGHPYTKPDQKYCLASANSALEQSGYDIVQSTDKHIAAKKGEFQATIVCATASSKIAFIVVNGDMASPEAEERIIREAFTQKMK